MINRGNTRSAKSLFAISNLANANIAILDGHVLRQELSQAQAPRHIHRRLNRGIVQQERLAIQQLGVFPQIDQIVMEKTLQNHRLTPTHAETLPLSLAVDVDTKDKYFQCLDVPHQKLVSRP